MKMKLVAGLYCYVTEAADPDDMEDLSPVLPIFRARLDHSRLSNSSPKSYVIQLKLHKSANSTRAYPDCGIPPTKTQSLGCLM